MYAGFCVDISIQLWVNAIFSFVRNSQTVFQSSVPFHIPMNESSRCFTSLLAFGACQCFGYPLQYSCLENPMDGGAWWAAIHGVASERLHFHFPLSCIGEGNGNPQPTPVFLPGESQGRGESGGLLSMGSRRVGHDCSDLAAAAAAVHN